MLLLLFAMIVLVSLGVAAVAAGEMWPESRKMALKWAKENEFIVGCAVGAFSAIFIQSAM